MNKIRIIILAVLLLPVVGITQSVLAARTVLRQQPEGGAWSRLRETTAWRQFKALWRQIGRISPGDPASRRLTVEPDLYSHAIGKGEYDRLLARLGDRIAGLAATGFSGEDRDFLDRVGKARLEYMYHGRARMPSRMVPSPVVLEEEQSLRRVELRIDLLETLRKTGKINGTEFRTALATARHDLCNIAVMRLVEAVYGRFAPLGNRILWHDKYRRMDLVERQLWIIGDHYHKAVDAYTQTAGRYAATQKALLDGKYARVVRELEAFRRRIPRFHVLIDELER